MFENVKVGDTITVFLGDATRVTGIALEARPNWIDFAGGITIYSDQGWKIAE